MMAQITKMNGGWDGRDRNESGEEKVLRGWQAKVESLDEWVCLLVMKNQILREENLAERTGTTMGNCRYLMGTYWQVPISPSLQAGTVMSPDTLWPPH
jgi:hypothetical protein